MTISDSNGKQVRKIQIPDGTTSSSLTWDGNTDAGVAAPAGDYTVTIDSGKSNAAITAQWQGRVDGIEMTAAGARLRMGDVLVAPADVRMIGLETGTSTSTSTTTP
jgi:flagellar hook assembly protein FlgD